MIKEIIYSNLEETDKVTRTVQRAKLLLVNSKKEILLANMNRNYQLPGGHLEENETLEECLFREVKEETGIEIEKKQRFPFLRIIYKAKDNPSIGNNSIYIANYYLINEDLIPNLDNASFTQEEIDGNMGLEWIHKDKALDILRNSISNCTRKKVVRDTINVIETYLDLLEETGNENNNEI